MLEVGGDLDLGQEAGAAEDGGELGVEDLDGDLAAVLGVLGEIDGGHAALAQLAHEPVAVGQGGLEPGDYFLHDIVSQKGASRCRERTALATWERQELPDLPGLHARAVTSRHKHGRASVATRRSSPGSNSTSPTYLSQPQFGATV